LVASPGWVEKSSELPFIGATSMSREIAGADPELGHAEAGDLDMCRLKWLILAIGLSR
jgi:hypothetical protein